MEEAQKPSWAELQRRLEQAARLLACFRQAVAHELPNQLLAVQGLMHLVQEEEADALSQQSHDYLVQAGAVVLRTRTLVRALAELERLQRQTKPPEPVSLAEVAREAAAEINQLFPGRAIEYHFPDEAPLLRVSRPALCWVLVLFMRNAVQGNPDQPLLCLEVGFREEQSGPVFWLADNGCGLAPPRLRRLQELCIRSTGSPEGIDFGLLVALQFVALWGGTLQVASEQGRGSVFTVFLKL